MHNLLRMEIARQYLAEAISGPTLLRSSLAPGRMICSGIGVHLIIEEESEEVWAAARALDESDQIKAAILAEAKKISLTASRPAAGHRRPLDTLGPLRFRGARLGQNFGASRMEKHGRSQLAQARQMRRFDFCSRSVWSKRCRAVAVFQ
jgi:hypothetical protein